MKFFQNQVSITVLVTVTLLGCSTPYIDDFDTALEQQPPTEEDLNATVARWPATEVAADPSTNVVTEVGDLGSLLGNSVNPEADATYLYNRLQQSHREINRLNHLLQQQDRTSSEDGNGIAQATSKPPPDSTTKVTNTTGALLPPNAKPGECYARVMVPAEYETVNERVLLQEASKQMVVVPEQVEWIEQQVMIKEASERFEVVPPTYETIEEQILITPESTRIEEVPAEYEWIEEKVLVKPAHTIWKKGRGPIQKVDNATGEIMCLVEVPATYKTVKKKVIKTPATTKSVTVPAEYKTIQKTVVATPASTRTVNVPAEYKTMKVKKIVQPAQKKLTTIPAKYQSVQKHVVKNKAQIGWRRVLCETNLSNDIVKRVQESLKKLGFDPGPVDGILGPNTHAAIQSYQSKENLAVGGLTLETLKNLGIQIPQGS